ncbi:MAG: 1-deoxy-D-xylulose-5-phosphate synthase N-terminal domain-containing protein [Bacillota bacterium]|nr:1-deoxy-D-xylulose-5-phosphate synthase N-terminal domain-containing protein [Bacillota bacterium]
MAKVYLESVPELIEKAGEIRKGICRCARYAGNVHLGGPLSATDITVALYYKHMGFDPERLEARDRTTFILSKGHCGVLLYCIFCDMGLHDWDELLHNYNRIGHTFGAHPNRKYVKGIEVSTGSLGHGLNWAIGYAHANRNEGINARIFCLLGDGEMEEGSNWEAIMYAASKNLSNIVAIVDYNHCSASFMAGQNIKWNSMADCYRAFGWDVYEIDGTDMYEIDRLLSNLPPVDFSKPGKPVCIISKTTKGQGVAFMQERSYAWHIGGLDDDKLAEAERSIEEYTKQQLRRD